MDIYRINHEQRARVKDEVATSLGPPDPTVLVQETEEGASVSIPQLLETFRKFGDVVLVRVTDDAILVTFKKSTSAVTATSVKEVSLCVESTVSVMSHGITSMSQERIEFKLHYEGQGCLIRLHVQPKTDST